MPTGEATALTPSRFIVAASVLSDVGCQRQGNEDYAAFFRPGDADVLAHKGTLTVVADGIGGEVAGEVASRTAVETISRSYFASSEAPVAALEKAFLEANHEIQKKAQSDASLRGMGTTCVALAVLENTAVAAYVGDSRLYLLRGEDIYLLTEDHSVVNEMVRQGLITREEARNHEDRNLILRALGSHRDVEISTWNDPLPICEGDRFLLCTDGLHDLVEQAIIQDIVMSSEPPQACETLVQLAKQRGGHDNITVAILNVLPVTVSSGELAPVTREAREIV